MKINKKYLKICILTLLTVSSKLHSQVTVLWDSVVSNGNYHLCQSSEEATFQFTLIATSAIPNSTIEVRMPKGLNFDNVVSSSLSNGGSISYISGSPENKPKFNVSAIAAGTNVIVRLKIASFADCKSINLLSAPRDTIKYDFGFGKDSAFSNQLIIPYASVSITDITNTPVGSYNVGDIFTRTIKITNAGLGKIKNWKFYDAFNFDDFQVQFGSVIINPTGNPLGGVPYNLGITEYAVSPDSLIINFDSTLNKTFGNGTSIFDESTLAYTESFYLSYDLKLNTCGKNGNVLSSLEANWGCYSKTCQQYNVINGIGINVPLAPNIINIKNLLRRKDCFNDNIERDTMILKNSGGLAKNLSITAGMVGYPSVFANNYPMQSFDTASLFYKIGTNGIWIKPNFNVNRTIVSDYSDLGSTCNLLGRPATAIFEVPELGANDSIFVIIGQFHCKFNYACQVANQFANTWFASGTALEYSYKNACGNVNYSKPLVKAISDRYIYLRGVNDGPSTIADGDTTDLKLNIQDAPGYDPYYFTNRAYNDIIITLPSVLRYDSNYPNPVYFEASDGTLIYPKWKPNANTYRFYLNSKITNSSKLHIRVNGVCQPGVCPFIAKYNITWKTNPDSTGCNYANTFGCLDYNFTWTTNCAAVCCQYGFLNTDYNIKRVNFGLPDNNNDKLADGTGTVDKTKARWDFIVSGDTVEFTHKGYILTDSSLGFPKFEYLRSIMDINDSSRWQILWDSAYVNRAQGRDTAIKVNYTISASRYIINDISQLRDFKNNDSVTFKVKMVWLSNFDGGFQSQVAGGASRDTFKTNFLCGDYITKLTNWSTISFLDAVNTVVADGCNEFSIYHALYTAVGSQRYANGNAFEYEYRNFSVPKSVLSIIPKGYIVDRVVFDYRSYSGQTTAYPIPNYTILPFTMSKDTLRYNVAQLFTPNGGTILPTDEGGTIIFRVFLTPTCKTLDNITEVLKQQANFTVYNYNHDVREIIGSASTNQSTSFKNKHTSLILSSAQPVSVAYTKKISWPLTLSNASLVNSLNNWVDFKNTSGLITIDSVKKGAVLMIKNSNGFYELGNIKADSLLNLQVFGTNNSCFYDSLILNFGYGCKGYPLSTVDTNKCRFNPITLYVQPQPTEIQTLVTPIQNTPINTATGTGALYGNTKINMCSEIPVELMIASVQPGAIYNVINYIIVPDNIGSAGLSFKSNSGFIEFPEGTTPRAFSVAANASLVSPLDPLKLRFSLEDIDPINFGINSPLIGTADLSKNRVKIRFNLTTNCNLQSGTIYTINQNAINSCGTVVSGNNTSVVGNDLNIDGVEKPFVGVFEISPLTSVSGCNNPIPVKIRLLKAGTTIGSILDSIRISIPLISNLANFTCVGSSCPSATPVFETYNTATRRVFTIGMPTNMANLDSMVFGMNIIANNNTGCESPSNLRVSLSRNISIFCPTSGANCTQSSVLIGQKDKSFSIAKADFTFSSYDARFKETSQTEYVVSANLNNISTITNSGIITVKHYLDKNLNGLLDVTSDSLVATTVLPSISASSTVNFRDSFYFNGTPNPNIRFFSSINATDPVQCMCNSLLLNSVIGLSISDLVLFDIKKLANVANLNWVTNVNSLTSYFELERRSGKGAFTKIAKINSIESLGNKSYSYNDNIQFLDNGAINYRLKSVLANGQFSYSAIRTVYKGEAVNSNIIVFPNPVTDKVSLILPDMQNIQSAVIELLNLDGKLISKTPVKITGELIDINVNQCANGVYLLRITTDNNQIFVEKVNVLK